MADDHPTYLRSVLRLFLSADVVGSTAVKQTPDAASGQSKDVGSPWFTPIAGFFRIVDRLFAKEWTRLREKASKHNWPIGPDPEAWKGLGDEIVYVKVLTDHREAECCLQCWATAIKSAQRELKQKYPNLDIKASAWTAGFPINNSEIIIKARTLSHTFGDDTLDDDDDPLYVNLVRLRRFYEEGPQEQVIRDYIGPSMDTGFRTASVATPRKLTLTVELAYMLSVSSQPPEIEMPVIGLRYDGRRSLKGVLGGIPYPIFWIDLADAQDRSFSSEDEILNQRDVAPHLVRRFCEEFIAETPQLFKPYIESDTESLFRTRPVRHDERLAHLRSYVENESRRRNQETQTEQDDGSEVARSEDLSTLMTSIRSASSSPSGER